MTRGFTIKVGNSGFLDDGRKFSIKEFKSLFVLEDGFISDYFQSIIVDIDGKDYKMSIKELGQHINYDRT